MQFHVAPDRLLRQRLPRADASARSRSAPPWSTSPAAARCGCAAPTRGGGRTLDPAYFSEPVDLEAMKAGARSAIEIAQQVAPRPDAGTGPSLHGSDTLDDAALEAHIARWTQTLYHPVGTCAMGSGDARRRRPRAARSRRRGTPGRRRVGDAADRPRQHQRRHDHDRREGRRPGPRARHPTPRDHPRAEGRRPMTTTQQTSHRAPPRSTSGTPAPARSSAPTRSTPRPTSGPRSSGPGRPPTWWSGLSYAERRRRLDAFRGVLARRIHQLAGLMSEETGKPASDAALEVALVARPPGLGRQARREGPRPPQGPLRAARPPTWPAPSSTSRSAWSA